MIKYKKTYRLLTYLGEHFFENGPAYIDIEWGKESTAVNHSNYITSRDSSQNWIQNFL